MAIDFTKGAPIGLCNEAPRYIPSRPSASTVYRWSVRGSKGVVLETGTIGGRRYTTREAVERFLEATNRPIRKKWSAEESSRSHKRAMEELAAEGI